MEKYRRKVRPGKRFVNDDLIRFQKEGLALMEKINQLQDEYDQVMEDMEEELGYLEPAMKRLDKNGMYIPADRSAIFYELKGWIK